VPTLAKQSSAEKQISGSTMLTSGWFTTSQAELVVRGVSEQATTHLETFHMPCFLQHHMCHMVTLPVLCRT